MTTTARPPARVVAVSAVLFAGITFWSVRHLLHLDYFFDEMWRVDFIRSGDWVARARLHDAFVPPGWVYVERFARPFTLDRPAGFRALGIGFFVLFLCTLLVVFVTVDDDTADARSRRRGLVTALAAVALLPVLPSFSDVSSYVNNYLFEAAYVGLIVLACLRLDENRRAFRVACVLFALSPLFVIGGLFALPALGGWLALWAWRHDGRRFGRAASTVAAAAAGAAVIGVGVYLAFYRIVASSELKDYWKDETAAGAGGQLGLVRRGFETFTNDVYQLAFPSLHGIARGLGMVVLFGALGYGTWIVGRRYPWLAALPYIGWPCAIVAAAVQGWPATPVRVNLPFFAFMFAMAPFGLFHLIARVTRRASAVAVCGVLAILVLWVPRVDPHPDTVFARRLRADLQLVRDSTTRDNVVLAYFFMTHWYVHDALVNDAPSGRQFLIERDVQGSDHLSRDANAIANPVLEAGGTVWCVEPYSMGPTAAAAACRLSHDGLVQIADEWGIQARILGYRLEGASSTPAGH